MAWHLLEKVIEHSAAHSTIFGKWWIAIMFIFRIIVVASIGDEVYDDEQEEFVCNTGQPGCTQICYNKFAPISHIRFWAFQILATGTPSIIFIIFATHKLALLPSKPTGEGSHKDCGTQTSWRVASSNTKSRENKSDKDKNSDKRSESRSSSRLNNSTLYREIDLSTENRCKKKRTSSVEPPAYDKICRERKIKRTKLVIIRAYVINVILRTLIEAGCLYLQYCLYQFVVPESFECIRYPCPKTVECYVSRPKEKTIFLFFMFGVSGLCIAINLVELKYLGWLRLKRALRIRSDPVDLSSVTQSESGSLDEFSTRNSRYYGAPRHLYGRIIQREPDAAPPGYYIPDIDPPSEKYASPANGFPHIRMRAASFTTSESDVTSDDAESVRSADMIVEESVRRYLS